MRPPEARARREGCREGGTDADKRAGHTRPRAGGQRAGCGGGPNPWRGKHPGLRRPAGSPWAEGTDNRSGGKGQDPGLGRTGAGAEGQRGAPQVYHLCTGPTAQALWWLGRLVRGSDAEAQRGALAMARAAALGRAPWAAAAHTASTETSGAGPSRPLPKPLLLGSEGCGKSSCLLDTAYRHVRERRKPA